MSKITNDRLAQDVLTSV